MCCTHKTCWGTAEPGGHGNETTNDLDSIPGTETEPSHAVFWRLASWYIIVCNDEYGWYSCRFRSMSWEWGSPDSLYIWSVMLQADGSGNDSDEVRAKQSLDSSGSSQPSAAQGSASSSSGNTTGSSTAATGKGSPKPISAANKKELLKGATMRTSVRLFLHAHAPVSCRDNCLKCEDCKDWSDLQQFYNLWIASLYWV